jgi:iron complex outermembrane recepter protein
MSRLIEMRHALSLGISVLVLGLCDVAAAQAVSSEAGAAADNTNPNIMDEIIVTAERRSENLLTTPISASVLSGEELAKYGVNVVDQLQFATPAATVNNFGQGIDFNIRGIGKAEHNTQTTTGVITYRDGVATFPGYFTAEPYYDIASVEVLRGPQGTFVGQNATGGAVFITSNDPEIGGSVDGYVLGQIGNYSDFALQGAINLPISDTFAARIAFNGEQRDSFYDIAGPYTGDDGVRIASGRLGLNWDPAGGWSVLFKMDYNYLDLSAYNADPANSPNDIFDISANADLLARDHFLRSVLKIEYEFDNGIILRSISGYQDGNTAYRADLDGTSAGFNTFRDSVDETIHSEEINLISPDTGRFTWVLGAYLQKDKYNFLPGQFVIGVPAGNPASEYTLEGTNPKDASAFFGQVKFRLSDSFELELGARYSKHRTENDVSVVQYGTPIEDQQKADFSDTSGKIALNWFVDDNNYLYAFVASGFRPGGLNVPVGLGQPDPFDAETVTDYEIGWKGSWASGHVRTQLNAYRNEYDKFQVIIGYPDFPVFGIELNTIGTTKISGFEAQVQALFGGFSLDAGLGAMSTELGTFYATDPRLATTVSCDPATGPESATCINLKGTDQTYAPDFTFNIGMQYDFMVGKDTITPRLNFGHVASQWATLFENESLGDKIEARNIFGGQIAWQHEDYTATLYATNLTDQHYVGALNSGLRFGGPPRQYGLRVTKTF